MFYKLTAYNSQAIVVWASSEADVDRYVDWLNRNREINVYSAAPVPKSEWSRHEDDEVMSMDEPGWDDFMADNA